MICPRCITHNSEGAESCHWCGAVLRQEQEASSAETVVACVACGGQINPTANFCNQCGVARIPLNEPVESEPQLACAHCGGSLNLGDNYCKWCGLPMPNSTGSTSATAAPTRPIWRKVAAPWGQGTQRKLENEQRRIAESQQKEEARAAFRESIEQSFALKEAERVAFREAIEKSFALKEEQRAQKELEREAARVAAREAAKIAAAEKKERRAQEEAKREAARKEAARRERERALMEPVKPAKEKDDFDVAAIAKTIVGMAPWLTGGKVSHADALLVKQVLEEFQKKSDDTSASAALDYFNIAALSWKFASGTATDRDMVIFAVYQFLNIYGSWKS